MDDYYDEEDYHNEYNKEIWAKLKALPEDDQEEYRKELENISYSPTNRPAQDVDYNLLRAKENIRKRDESNKDDHVESFLDHIAKNEGKLKAEIRKKYKKAMGKEGRTGLSKWDI